MLLTLPGPDKSLFEYINQLIQALDTDIRMGMFPQMIIALIHQEHRRSAGSMTRGHIINAIANLNID